MKVIIIYVDIVIKFLNYDNIDGLMKKDVKILLTKQRKSIKLKKKKN